MESLQTDSSLNYSLPSNRFSEHLLVAYEAKVETLVLGTWGIRRLIIHNFFTSRGSPSRGKKKNESTTTFNARRTTVNISTKFPSKSHKMTEARIINFSPGTGRLTF